MKIKELAQKYDLSKDDFWELKRGTKSMWIITHDACEKIAAKENIQFGAPTIYRDSNQDVAIVGDAKRGNKVIWSTGEASPKNCKAPYMFAMAEKRLKDRLILKLINAYEYGIYSDSEADNFKKQ
jgi:hypothetical protein|tara:strand:- start:8345 stop:8719 length:375 start_codon:yes stop_codon:yes gene_type:complete